MGGETGRRDAHWWFPGLTAVVRTPENQVLIRFPDHARQTYAAVAKSDQRGALCADAVAVSIGKGEFVGPGESAVFRSSEAAVGCVQDTASRQRGEGGIVEVAGIVDRKGFFGARHRNVGHRMLLFMAP